MSSSFAFRLLLTALAGLVFLTGTSAHSAQVVWRTGPCPIGDDTVRVFSLVSENKVGGWDSDTAPYSADGQWRTHKIATCADNLFSLYSADIPTFQPSVALTGKLNGVLTQARRELADPESPQVWERYRIAARMYAEIGRSSWFMANLWLEASWTVRDSGVGYYEGLNGPDVTMNLLNAGDAELIKGLPSAQEKAVRFNLARVAHRGGYALRRDAHLHAYKALGALTPREADAVRRLETAAKLEPSYQTEALHFFEIAMEDPALTPVEQATARYLAGDLERRLGRPAAARPHFEKAVADPNLPQELAQMAGFLLQGLPAGN
ncbi:MAG: hypothetical protein CL927_13310 [Deltaproteobacteria bacterium]|nr:hypothetical protein [Deltaproteobacteria bacterium]